MQEKEFCTLGECAALKAAAAASLNFDHVTRNRKIFHFFLGGRSYLKSLNQLEAKWIADKQQAGQSFFVFFSLHYFRKRRLDDFSLAPTLWIPEAGSRTTEEFKLLEHK